MQTRTAHIELQPSGIIFVRIVEGANQTVEDAKENIATSVKASGGVLRPILVDVRRGQSLTAEARHYYSGQVLVDSFSAIGMLIEASALGRMMGNVYIRISRPGVPVSLFTSEAAAVSWLQDHRR